jgi:hypothetical protein
MAAFGGEKAEHKRDNAPLGPFKGRIALENRLARKRHFLWGGASAYR